MAISQVRHLVSTNPVVVAGEGDVTFTSTEKVVYYAIAESSTVTPLGFDDPSEVVGHAVKYHENESLSLKAGEFLWLCGNASVCITADTYIS